MVWWPQIWPLPAYPHATLVAVYPALFFLFLLQSLDQHLFGFSSPDWMYRDWKVNSKKLYINYVPLFVLAVASREGGGGLFDCIGAQNSSSGPCLYWIENVILLEAAGCAAWCRHIRKKKKKKLKKNKENRACSHILGANKNLSWEQTRQNINK